MQVRYIPSRVYTQVHYIQGRVYMRDADQKSCMHMHALSCTERCVHVGKLIFGSVVFRPMVLVLGIASEVLNPGIGSLVLVLNGFFTNQKEIVRQGY